MIKWGMIGAGDVTEVKSGPAFKKVPDSDLVAVMRRDEAKVRDYAERHGITDWYTDANALLANPDVNAIYIATPPHMHLHYAEKALRAGKKVYVEKPVALNTGEARQMKSLVRQYNGHLVVAHYRRAIPYFVKIKAIVDEGLIGQPRLVNLRIYKKALSAEELAVPRIQWRIDPAVSGGGLFHDLAPHQVDLMVAIFGRPLRYNGTPDSRIPAVRVAGQMLFAGDVLFNGVWDFDQEKEADTCEIIGTKGSLRFSFFDKTPILLEAGGEVEEFVFEPLPHVQAPMIAQTVQYFLDRRSNPCSIDEGLICMQVLDAFTAEKGE